MSWYRLIDRRSARRCAGHEFDRQLPTQRGFGQFCDSHHQLNDTKCHELRLVECGVKLESVLVYSFDGVADGLIFERSGGERGRDPRGPSKWSQVTTKRFQGTAARGMRAIVALHSRTAPE